MVKVVKVSSTKKKQVKKDDRAKKGVDYIKSLGPAQWANPKDSGKEEFGPVGNAIIRKAESKEGADWATPKGVMKEDFGPTGVDIKLIEEPVIKSPFKKIKTGVPGLDEILDGGIPQNNLINVSGGPGSGKTILCLQFIYKGAKDYKEPGVFISLEEDTERLKNTAKSFGWDLDALIKQNLLVLVKTPLFKFEILKNAIRDNVNRVKAKRLVIDPGALFELFFDRDVEVRKAIIELGAMLKKLGVTTIITTEEAGSPSFNQGDFSSDGIIYTYYKKVSNQFMRMIGVIKMRGTSHSEKIHPLRFTKKGLEVLYDEEVFQDVSQNYEF